MGWGAEALLVGVAVDVISKYNWPGAVRVVFALGEVRDDVGSAMKAQEMGHFKLQSETWGWLVQMSYWGM